MKYLLMLTLLSYVPAFVFIRDMYGPGAEFDRALPAFVAGLLAAILTAAYALAALWFHRLL